MNNMLSSASPEDMEREEGGTPGGVGEKRDRNIWVENKISKRHTSK